MGADKHAVEDMATHRLGMSGPRFAWMVVSVGIVAALASVVTVVLSLKLWTMFIGWTCFSSGAGDLGRGARAIACLVIGVVLGMGSIVVLGALTPGLGQWALPLVIFVLAVVAMLSLLIPPLDSIPGYFLGMTAFYASGLEPAGPSLAPILSAALLGGLAAALAAIALKLYDRWRAGGFKRS